MKGPEPSEAAEAWAKGERSRLWRREPMPPDAAELAAKGEPEEPAGLGGATCEHRHALLRGYVDMCTWRICLTMHCVS